MDEEKQIIEAAKALGLGELVPEIYHDMLQPAVRQIGEGLSTIAKAVKIALAPVEAGVWGYEQIREWLSVRVTRILSDRKAKKIEPPPLSIAGPLILQLIFAKNEPDLKELYASLLASAMDSSNKVSHPSFVSIIQQLTSDEAKILRYLSSQQADQRNIYERSNSEGEVVELVKKKFNSWCKQASVKYPGQSEFYMDNLIRLRIFRQEMTGDIKFNPDAVYPEDVQQWSEYMNIELTPFGNQFLDACIEKMVPNQ